MNNNMTIANYCLTGILLNAFVQIANLYFHFETLAILGIPISLGLLIAQIYYTIKAHKELNNDNT